MRSLDRKNTPWDINKLVKKMQDGTAVVDSTSQRGLVWDLSKKIDLIESIIFKVNIGAITCNKKGEIYSIIDGQQRGNAIAGFISNKFVLKGILPYELSDGTEVDLNGKTFDEFPEELKKRIKGQSLLVYSYEDLSMEEEAFVIKKLNNGKPMTTIELGLIGAKSYPVYRELRDHDLFKVALTETAMNGSVYAEIVAKAWIMLYGENKCFNKNVFQPIMQGVAISGEEKEGIIRVFDKIFEVYGILTGRTENKGKNKKAARKMIMKLHLLSLMPIINRAIEENMPAEKIADWIVYFFSGEDKETTISDSYNDNCLRGTGHPAAIQARMEAIEMKWNEYDFG